MYDQSKKVYKYLRISNHLFENIENNMIAFTHVDLLNDPFEGVAQYKCFEDKSGEWEAYGIAFPQMMNKKIQDISYEKICNRCRLFCVTENRYNPLMWAHYADEHRGVCLEYDIADIVSVSDDISEIKYVSKVQSFDDFPSNANKAIFYKSDYWAYEKEIRAVKYLSDEECISIDYNDNYKCLYLKEKEDDFIYFPIGRSSTNNLRILKAPKVLLLNCKVTGIYLGLRIKQEDEVRLKDIAGRKGIPIYRITMSDNSYTLKSEIVMN